MIYAGFFTERLALAPRHERVPIQLKSMKSHQRGGRSIVHERLGRDLRAALTRIVECEDAPDIDIGGEARLGLHCGVEDRNLRDRYEGADYGYAQGVERALRWAVNEVQSILDSLPNDKTLPTEGAAKTL